MIRVFVTRHPCRESNFEPGIDFFPVWLFPAASRRCLNDTQTIGGFPNSFNPGARISMWPLFARTASDPERLGGPANFAISLEPVG